MIGIYKITNIINDKCYVGQSTDIERRWNEHKHRAFNVGREEYNHPLYRSIRKYGLKNFSFEVIEECLQSELNEKEIYYIEIFDSYNNGYNLDLGGNTNLQSVKVSPEILNKILYKLEKTNESFVSIGRELGISESTIRNINYGKPFYVDKNRSYPIREDLRIFHSKNFCEICGIELSNYDAKYCKDCAPLFRRKSERPDPIELAKNIKELGIAEVARQHGVQETSVIAWCKNYGMPQIKEEIIIWYNNQIGINESVKVRTKSIKNRIIEQLDPDTNKVIATFDGPLAAARALDLKDSAYGSISKACKGLQETAYSFKWKYADEEEPQNVKIKENKTFCRPVRQIDPDSNEVITTYNSLKEASQLLHT